jgi:hypothetical protein
VRNEEGLAKRCVCGHGLGWHLDLEGKCAIGGCDCVKFEGIDAVVRRQASGVSGERAEGGAVAMTQAPPKLTPHVCRLTTGSETTMMHDKANPGRPEEPPGEERAHARTHPDEIPCATCDHIRSQHEWEDARVGRCGQSGCECKEYVETESVEEAEAYYRDHSSTDLQVAEEERQAKERAATRDLHHDPKTPGPPDEKKFA